MTYSYQRISIRPNTDVEFYVPDSDYTTHFDTTYLNTGKCTTVDKTVSTDQLTLTVSLIWTDLADWTAFSQDPVVLQYIEARNVYNDANNIISYKVDL